MGTPLTSATVATTYQALVKVGDNTAISSTLKRMSDGLGNDLPLYINNSSLTNYGNGGDIWNTAFGENALINNTATFSANSAFGNESLKANTTGFNNSAFGYSVLSNNTNGTSNSGFGAFSLVVNTSGSYNTSIGNYALSQLLTGQYNTALGYNSGRFITSGVNNCVIGSMTGGSLSTGTNNTIIGTDAGSKSNDISSNNVLLGYNAGFRATGVIGSQNTFLGSNTQANSEVSSSIVLGANAVATASNQLSIGAADTPVGTVTTESVSSTMTWTVLINGVTRKILLA